VETRGRIFMENQDDAKHRGLVE